MRRGEPDRRADSLVAGDGGVTIGLREVDARRDRNEAAGSRVEAGLRAGGGVVGSGELRTDEVAIPGQEEPSFWCAELPRGGGLRLAYPSVHDVRAYVAVRRASRGFHLAWEPRRAYDPTGPEAFRRLVAQHDTRLSQRMFVWLDDGWAGEPAVGRDGLVDGGGGLVGQVSLSLVRPGPARTAYLGYWVSAASAGRGVGTKAVGLALEHAFGNLGLHRVEANVQPENEASIRLVRRLGFREEGLCRKYLQINGEWRDHVRYSVLAEEWGSGSSAE